MRKIEQEMLNAISAGRNWSSGNTMVADGKVYLHGHHIATCDPLTGKATPNLDTLRQWPTVTTKSRLRALGVNVTTKNYTTYVDGVEV